MFISDTISKACQNMMFCLHAKKNRRPLSVSGLKRHGQKCRSECRNSTTVTDIISTISASFHHLKRSRQPSEREPIYHKSDFQKWNKYYKKYAWSDFSVKVTLIECWNPTGRFPPLSVPRSPNRVTQLDLQNRRELLRQVASVSRSDQPTY